MPCALTAASVGAVVWVGVADLFVEAAESLGRIGALAVVVPTRTDARLPCLDGGVKFVQ